MVQSLLLTGSASIKNSELSIQKDNDVTDKSADTLQQVELKDKQQNFSDVLKESIENNNDSKPSTIDKTIVTNTENDVNAASIANENELTESENEAQDQSSLDSLNEDLAVPVSDVIVADDNAVSEIELLSNDNKISELDNNQNSSIESINPEQVDDSNSEQAQLLSSIQAAQQVNTNINNTTDNIDETEAVNAKATTIEQFAKGNENTKANLQTSAEKAAQIVASKTADGGNIDNELLIGSSNDEVQRLTTGKGEDFSNLLKTDASVTQAVADVNGTKPIQTNLVQTDKLVALNQQTQANNNLLEQPVDIQSKQAASIMGERVMMMISQGKQEVQIRLDPAELGSMFIKVQVQQDQVQLNIQTQAGLSKDIIEQNMPRLREQLAQQGIQLGDANVEQQSQQSSQQQSQQNNRAINNLSGTGTNNAESSEDNQTAMWIPSKIASKEQGIDYYA